MSTPRHELLEEILRVARLMRQYEPPPDLPDNLAMLAKDSLRYRLSQLVQELMDGSLDT